MSDTSKKIMLNGLSKGRLDVVIGLLLVQLSQSRQLRTIDIRFRSASTVGSPILNTLNIPETNDKRALRYSTVTSVTFSKDDRFFGEHTTEFWEHYEHDAFDVDTQVGKLLKYPQLSSLSLIYCSPNANWHDSLPIASKLKRLSLKWGLPTRRVAFTTFATRLSSHIISTFPLIEHSNIAYHASCNGHP